MACPVGSGLHLHHHAPPHHHTQARQGDRVGVCVTQLDSTLIERGLACAPGAWQAAYQEGLLQQQQNPTFLMPCIVKMASLACMFKTWARACSTASLASPLKLQPSSWHLTCAPHYRTCANIRRVGTNLQRGHRSRGEDQVLYWQGAHGGWWLLYVMGVGMLGLTQAGASSPPLRTARFWPRTQASLRP